MRNGLTTQLGWRPIQKLQKRVKPSEVEVRLWKVMETQGTNHDITPPSKVQCPNAQCWLRVRSLRVGVVEFGNKLLGALYIMDGAPFVFFNTIAHSPSSILGTQHFNRVSDCRGSF